MSNSKLVSYTKLSPNYNPRGNNKILKITPHHMAGKLTLEQCYNAVTSRGGSSNYGIDVNGKIGLFVEEKNRAWTSSSPENDYVAVTIEVANDQIGGNWHISDKSLNALITLCTDICKRNGIKKLNFTGNKKGNLTMHKYFAPTACPGPYLASKFPYITSEVNKRLSNKTDTTKKDTKTKPATITYRVRKSWKDEDSQIGAYTSLDNAKKACKVGYSVFNSKGKAIYTKKAKYTKKSYAKGATVKISSKTVYVASTGSKGYKKSGTYYLYDGKVVDGRMRITNNKANCGKTPIGIYVTGWVNKKDI